jgi:Fe-S cluster biogenesis protein NfuA
VSDQAESLKNRVARVLAEEIAPALEMDGTVLEVLDVTDRVVRLRLGTAGACCPSTVMAIIMSIEEELRRRVSEVEYLEAVP